MTIKLMSISLIGIIPNNNILSYKSKLKSLMMNQTKSIHY